MSRYQPIEPVWYADEGFEDEPKTNSTVIRRPYPGAYPSSKPAPTTAADVCADLNTAEIDTVAPHLYSRQGRTMERARRRRPDTDETINEHVIQAYTSGRQSVYRPGASSEVKQPEQKHSRRKIIAWGVAAAGVIAGLDWGHAEGEQIANQLAEGNDASCNIALQCGHHDSAFNKTELHAYINPDTRHFTFIELPGGQDHLREAYTSPKPIAYQGRLSNVGLTIEPQYLEATRLYQISVHLQTYDPVFFAKQYTDDWVFIDSGKGYYVFAGFAGDQ